MYALRFIVILLFRQFFKMKAPVEVQFAQKLAANEKVIRDRAVRKLKIWLGRRSTGQAALEEEELMRYGMSKFQFFQH
jgi:hypothetical protein